MPGVDYSVPSGRLLVGDIEPALPADCRYPLAVLPPPQRVFQGKNPAAVDTENHRKPPPKRLATEIGISITMAGVGSTCFSDLDDDILVHIFSIVCIADILKMRQVCKRLRAISRLRIVWTRALASHVLEQGFPFSDHIDVNSIDCSELEYRTRRAYQLGQFWLDQKAIPRELAAWTAGNSATGISDVRFSPGHPDWLFTVSKGIWSMITCWELGGRGDHYNRTRQLAEWSPRQTLITGIAVNSDPGSEACLAVSVTLSGAGRQEIEILTVREVEGEDRFAFHTLQTISTPFRVMSLHGDILASSDDVNETHVHNWRTGDYAVLWGSNEPSEHNFQHNRCLQVVLTANCVFVVRARSFEVFPELLLSPSNQMSVSGYTHPICRHQFGWIDGVAMSSQKAIQPPATSTPPFSIVLRAESDDPWSSDVHTLDLFDLEPNPNYGGHPAHPSISHDTVSYPPVSDDDAKLPGSAYIFPPLHRTSWRSARGHLRCTDILLGSHGTAIWVLPRPARNLDLTALDVHASDTQGPGGDSTREALVAAILPGHFKDNRQCVPGPDNATDVRTLCTYEGTSGNWTSVDYDEPGGRIALGDSQGKVRVLDL